MSPVPSSSSQGWTFVLDLLLRYPSGPFFGVVLEVPPSLPADNERRRLYLWGPDALFAARLSADLESVTEYLQWVITAQTCGVEQCGYLMFRQATEMASSSLQEGSCKGGKLFTLCEFQPQRKGANQRRSLKLENRCNRKRFSVYCY